VLLCLKDSNGKTRDAANQLIVSMAVRGDIVQFVKVTLAALGSETSHMRSAVVMALSRLVFEQGWANDEFHALLPTLLKTILVLINEGSREVIKSVVGFIRICVAAIPAEQLEPLIPELIGSLLKSQHAKSRFRAKIKIILKKLVKLFGYDALMPHVPASETRLLSHMRKLDERERRKKLASRNERAASMNGPNLDDYDAMFESDEDDSDDGRTLMTGATGLTRRTKQLMTMEDGKSVNSKRSSKTAATGMTSKSKLPVHPSLRLPSESNGEIVDLLSSNISKKVQFQSQYDNDGDSDDDDDDDDNSAEMMFDDDGKLVVRDDNDDRKSTTVEMDEIIPMQGHNKRRRLMSSSSSLHSKGQSSQNSKPKKKNSNKSVPSIGASYQSKKAGGDVKKKGQIYEPYAYMPLDGRAYTKKHRRTTVEQMATVVRSGSGSKGGQNRSNSKNNKRKR
jgi:ribosomal RNA-processing protein 12